MMAHYLKQASIVIPLFLLGIFLMADVYAQESLFDGVSSAGVVGSPVEFNCDFFDPVGIPNLEMVMHYRGQADTAFSQATMTHMNEYPYYTLTYESELQFGVSPGILDYYFSAQAGTLMATQSPYNSNNSFPPPAYLYANLAPDALGDTLPGSIGGWLDLTESGMSYSDTRVYGYLSNATGDWPTSQGFDYFFAYALGIYDPSNLDSLLFAMVYIDVPFFFSPGLYKLNPLDTSLSQIAEIDYAITDGKLHMAFDIDDLVNDPDWSQWPPQSGFVVTMGLTITASLSFDIAINDFTFPSFYEPQTQFLSFNSNEPPTIFDRSLSGDEHIGMEAIINYHDPDGNLPLMRRFSFDWDWHDMGSYDHIYSDSSQFEYLFPWPGEGWHYFWFEFSDGADTARTPLDSVYLTPTGIDGRAPVAQDFALYQNYPNPFNAITSIGFEIAQAGHVTLSVYDVAGRLIALLADRYLTAGAYTLSWNGENNAGQIMASGVYYYRLTTNGQSIARKMVYLK